jgi:prepilin-type N-terminal cleavage/methylation domain-containing protein
MNTPRLKTKNGFTLVEMMVALAAGTLVVVVVLASFGGLSTSLKATENYRTMHHDVRYAINLMRRDITKGAGVSACVSSNRLEMNVQNAGTNRTAVVYNMVSNSLFRTEGAGAPVTLATGVDKITFTLYDQSGQCTNDTDSAHFVGVKMEMKIQGVRDTYTDELQVRSRMRIKGL